MEPTTTERTRSFRTTLDLDATPEQVWAALTQAEELVRWFPPEARVKPGQGGTMVWSWGYGEDWETRIDAWEPGRLLRLVQESARPYDAQGRQLPAGEVEPARIAVEFSLETHQGKTRLRLVHSGFGRGAAWDAGAGRHQRGVAGRAAEFAALLGAAQGAGSQGRPGADRDFAPARGGLGETARARRLRPVAFGSKGRRALSGDDSRRPQVQRHRQAQPSRADDRRNRPGARRRLVPSAHLAGRAEPHRRLGLARHLLGRRGRGQRVQGPLAAGTGSALLGRDVSRLRAKHPRRKTAGSGVYSLHAFVRLSPRRRPLVFGASRSAYTRPAARAGKPSGRATTP